MHRERYTLAARCRRIWRRGGVARNRRKWYGFESVRDFLREYRPFAGRSHSNLGWVPVRRRLLIVGGQTKTQRCTTRQQTALRR